MPAKVLWPAHESLYDLMVLRATIGVAAFNSERQNDPQNPELAEWPAEYLDWPGMFFDAWPTHLDIKTLALDPSKGKDAKHGDYSAYVRLGRDRCGVIYLEADLRRRNAEEIVADGIEHCRVFQPDGFAIETNQFQELLVAPFLQAAQAQHMTLPIYTIENTVPKVVRIRRLGPYLAQRLVRFKSRSPGTQLLIDQLRDFPHGSFDDGADAAEGALRLAIDLFNERTAAQQQPRGYRP
jgi:predicted phage terminase large subunit-like protein